MLTGLVDVFRVGGDVDEGTQITSYIEVGFPKYKQGDQYVLFMTFNTYATMFQPKNGPDGSYEIVASTSINPLGRSPLAVAQQGRPASTFIADLKALAQP